MGQTNYVEGCGESFQKLTLPLSVDSQAAVRGYNLKQLAVLTLYAILLYLYNPSSRAHFVPLIVCVIEGRVVRVRYITYKPWASVLIQNNTLTVKFSVVTFLKIIVSRVQKSASDND